MVYTQENLILHLMVFVLILGWGREGRSLDRRHKRYGRVGKGVLKEERVGWAVINVILR